MNVTAIDLLRNTGTGMSSSGLRFLHGERRQMLRAVRGCFT